MVFDLAVRISKQIGIRIEFVNLGGGIGIPYRPEHKPVDLQKVGRRCPQALSGNDRASRS